MTKEFERRETDTEYGKGYSDGYDMATQYTKIDIAMMLTTVARVT